MLLILGGISSIEDLEDETVVLAANFALSTLDAYDDDDNKRVFSKIIKGRKQVVAGILYYLDISMFMSSCSESFTECTPGPEDRQFICSVKVISQPWMEEKMKLIDSHCAPADKDNRHMKKNRNLKKEVKNSRNEKKEEKKLARRFKKFLAEHKKLYSSRREMQRRFEIYRQNQNIIKELQENEQGTAVYGDTFFADLTQEEFQYHKGLNMSYKRQETLLKKAVIPKQSAPEEFDWRNKSAVTPVKNQGSCGSCWAFSVTGNLEGVYSIKHGELLSFSEQELLDCDKLDGACNGGLPENAYKAIEDLGGLETEDDYPYKGHGGQKCSIDSSEQIVKIKDFLEISQDEEEIAQWLAENGPVSVGINANVMQFYRRGVSHPKKFFCNPKNLDHGVLIVGYGTEITPVKQKVLPYWIVKNSWGTRWGEQGYYRVYRGDGTCGINTMVTSAVVE
ncbi:putative cysteine proteinase CG12163 [Artemia franciscana]|uniref:putative cysteine proteinase CG12163 n=1 Tax=Artemia franciscana TaxID=6661 RepID=UPI0032D9BE6B